MHFEKIAFEITLKKSMEKEQCFSRIIYQVIEKFSNYMFKVKVYTLRKQTEPVNKIIAVVSLQ